MSEQLQRRIGLGVMLQADDVGGNFSNFGAVVSGYDHAGAKADIANCEILTDTWKRKGKAGIDPGEVTLMLALDPRVNTSYSRCCTLLATTGFDAATNFRFLYPVAGTDNSTHTESFLAYVSSVGRQFKKAELIVAPVTLTIDGSPGMGNAS